MSKIIAILHCDAEYGIGKKNDLLFRVPKDMAFFRKTTSGHTVAMGENTLLSFPNQAPLKNRVNIVLSQDPTHNYGGCVNVHSFEEFLKTIEDAKKQDDVFIIGGAETFFPNIDEDPSFECVYASEPEDDNGHTIRFTRYRKR